MSIKLFLICVWSVGVFSVRAAVPVEGIIYFKEGKSVGFSGDHRVCIPKKGKDVKAFRGIFTRDKQKEVYPAEEIDSIVCWHPRTPEFRRKFILAEGIGWCWQYFATPHIGLTFTPDGAMVSLLTEESRFGNGEGSSVVRG